jgi:thioesterase domain-containing protein
VEEMAACYLREIREVQPHGPYRLGGWSSGGLIAYEIANQLIGADEPVEFLGLMDTAPDYAESASKSLGLPNHGSAASDFAAWIKGLAWVPQITPSDIRMHLDSLKSVEQILEYCQQVRLLSDEVDVGTLRRHLHVQYAMAVALRKYVLPRIPVSVSLFAASDERREDPTIGWRKVTESRVRVKCVSGTHHSMMESPQVERLAAELTRELNASRGDSTPYPEQQYAPLITIKLGREGTRPLICVPGAGAPVTAFAALADVLDSRMTIYGMQPRGLCGTMTPHIDVPSAARAYVAAIREARIPGPYRLLGHSFGGWVVMEMGLQLIAAGEHVAALIVLDSDAPCSIRSEGRYRTREELLVELVRLFEQIAGRSLSLRASDFAPLDHDAQLALLLSRLTEVKLMPPRTTAEVLGGIVRTFATNANTDYRPDRQYGGPMYFAMAKPAANGYAHSMSHDELVARWSEYAPRIQVWRSAGNHMSMLSDPYLKAMAAWLSPLLE